MKIRRIGIEGVQRGALARCGRALAPWCCESIESNASGGTTANRSASAARYRHTQSQRQCVDFGAVGQPFIADEKNQFHTCKTGVSLLGKDRPPFG